MISEFFTKRFWSIFSITFYVMNGSWISREMEVGKKSECFAWKELAPLWTWSANTYIVEYVVLCSSDIWTKQLWVYEACQPSMQLCCYRLVLNQNVMILDPSHYPYKNSFCFLTLFPLGFVMYPCPVGIGLSQEFFRFS
jgi:hypothetical protein